MIVTAQKTRLCISRSLIWYNTFDYHWLKQCSSRMWLIYFNSNLLPYRLLLWDYFGPLLSSTWAVLTALCAAAWFRESSRKQLTRGSNKQPYVPPPSSPPSIPSPPPAVHNRRWGKGQALSVFSDINRWVGNKVVDVYSLLVQWRNTSIDFTAIWFFFSSQSIPVTFQFNVSTCFFWGSSFTLGEWGQSKQPAGLF